MPHLPLVPASRPRFSALTEAVLAHARDIPAQLEAAMLAAPDHPRLYALRALMLVTLGRAELLPIAREAAAKARILSEQNPVDAADAAFINAGEAAANGDWWAAIEHLEACLRLDADDSLAAKMNHAIRFMLGDKAGMLRSIRQVLARLSPDHPHRGFLLGCHAFALEENGHYAEAEHVGREAVARESRDAWGLHAVSHVHEMKGRFRDGIAWIEGNQPKIAHCNNFGGHLFWHLALFKLEAGAVDEVFTLYDTHIRRDKTDDFRDIANGAALLSRLELEGYAVSNRWEELADKAEARLNDHALVFADLHYTLALLGAGRIGAAKKLAMGLLHPIAPSRTQKSVADAVGGTMAEGLIAYAEGRFGDALEKLSSTRESRALLGGSDAQRDVFEQIMVESALHAGEGGVVQSLLTARLRQRQGRNLFAAKRLERLNSRAIGRQPRGALALGVALAFAQPAE